MLSSNHPSLRSWIHTEPTGDFPIQNLPFGIARHHDEVAAYSAIGQFGINLHKLMGMGYFEGIDLPWGVFAQDNLNWFIEQGKGTWRAVRNRLSDILRIDTMQSLKGDHSARQKVLIPLNELQMLLPVYVRDYTDFYSSEEHATNVGTMFRGKENALMPNWKHLPVGYHGRASSIVVSGTPIRRPHGQKSTPEGEVVFGPSNLLDFELEMAFIVGKSTRMGQQVSVAEADDHTFGMVIFNDWSARDIQAWEYVPLGPFLGKNFGSSMSPWVVTMDALKPFRVQGPVQNPPVLPYLQFEGARNYDIELEVEIVPPSGQGMVVCRSNHKHLYWNMAQQLAHHTVNGCNVAVGDLMASGTISGPEKGSFGSMLEITWRGANPVKMPDGTERKFIQDHDRVIMRASCVKDGVRIGFGEVSGEVLPA